MNGHQSPMHRTLVSIVKDTYVTKYDLVYWTPESGSMAIYVQKFDKRVSFQYVIFFEKIAGYWTMVKTSAFPAKRPRGTWIQTDREAHEAWAILAKKPAASAVMHILCANIGEHNAVVISQDTIAKLCHLSSRSVRRAVADLIEGNWIEVRQIGATSQTNAYIVNDRVAWQGSRDGLRYSLFSATVVASSEEQPDADRLNNLKPLRRLPRIGEDQLPTGPGLPPPSQPFLNSLEPDLPSTTLEDGKSDDHLHSE